MENLSQNSVAVDEQFEEKTDGIRTYFRKIAISVTESKVRAKLSEVPTLMKQRFDKLFKPNCRKILSNDIPATKRAAYSSALELLSFYTAIRLEDDQYDTIWKTLFAALLESPTTSAYILNAKFWQDVPESRTLIIPVRCKFYWENFESATTGAIEDAKTERKTVSSLVVLISLVIFFF